MTNHSSFKGLLLAVTIMSGPVVLATTRPATAQIGIAISVQVAPPLLPVYVQPAMPELGYIWTPGYWAWAEPAGYYWVPGTWVEPPVSGVLWTPPYWGWNDGVYLFHAGYWGEHVGFYGGVNYGFGYGGSGYGGGRWHDGQFAYNRSVNNFGSVHVTNIYRQNVTVNNRSQVSFNGGAGGIRAEPNAAQREAEHETHAPVTAAQTRHASAAASNPAFAASRNNGHPGVAATSHPGQFEGAGVVHPQAARTAPGEHAGAHPEAAPHEAARPAAAEHAAARPEAAPHEAARPAAAEHAAARPEAAPHEGARPAASEHAAARPAAAQHEAARPQPAQQHAAARPEPQHAAPARPAPVQHAAAPRPQQAPPAAAPRPQPPQQHAAARPAPEKGHDK